jgi:LysR family transcriptional regulator (chromosome initiation inhibitor)
MDLAQLQALAAAVDGGSFDAAARALHVTPSAISQRIRALENSVGSVLLARSKPIAPTTAGAPYVRLARQIDALAADAAIEAAVQSELPLPRIPIAINGDSLATWVMPALAELADEMTFDIHREDQDHSAELLRDGTVMAAITTEVRPVQGCTSTRLGTMRYRPMAAPAFAERWLPDGVDARALATAPVVVFDRKDDIQDRYLRRFAADLTPPRHYVPVSADFAEAVRLGFGSPRQGRSALAAVVTAHDSARPRGGRDRPGGGRQPHSVVDANDAPFGRLGGAEATDVEHPGDLVVVGALKAPADEIERMRHPQHLVHQPRRRIGHSVVPALPDEAVRHPAFEPDAQTRGMQKTHCPSSTIELVFECYVEERRHAKRMFESSSRGRSRPARR